MADIRLEILRRRAILIWALTSQSVIYILNILLPMRIFIVIFSPFMGNFYEGFTVVPAGRRPETR